MKTFICSHVGSTEGCADCEFSLPGNSMRTLNCEFQMNAKHLEAQYPLYYKDDNSYYLLRSASSAVKFTLYEQTFFASSFSDAYQIANVFLNAHRIPEELFADCVSFIQKILADANLEVSSDRVVSRQHSDSFL
jgi:hypothetical protein